MFDAIYSLRRKHVASFSIEVVNGKGSWSATFSWLRRAMILIYLMFISFVIVRIFYKQRVVPKQSITYLDTFSTVSDFDADGRFIDRYYPGLLQTIEPCRAKNIWYAPVIYGIRTPYNLKYFFDCANRSGERFLLMEQWLKASDYFFSLIYSCILPRQLRVIPDYCGINVTKIVKEEAISDLCSTSLFNSLLRYRFILRLKHAGVEIEKVIDWSENQVIDRALCLAVRKFYPKVHIIGYQGFIVSEHYLSHEPACYERDAGTIPDTLCVLNSSLVERK